MKVSSSSLLPLFGVNKQDARMNGALSIILHLLHIGSEWTPLLGRTTTVVLNPKSSAQCGLV